MPVQYKIAGRRASAIAASIEAAIRDGDLAAGAALPTVRTLAGRLKVSPATVGSAYQRLRARGLLTARRRAGTSVSPRPPLTTHRAPATTAVPAGVRDLTYGTPDAALLPPLAPALACIDPRSRLYGEPVARPELLALARARLASEGLPAANLTVVSGALDGVERVLQAHLRPGDRVAVEDPGFGSAFDLLNALGLDVEPVAIDDDGPLPDDLARALARRVDAFLLTPRAQNPSGAALDAARAAELRAVLRKHPDVLVIEDDHAGPVAGVPAVTVCDDERRRFAVIRSVSKSLGPDLRLAVLAGDAATVARVEGRQAVGAGWVSHILQDIVVALWSDARVTRQLRVAAERYAARRDTLVAALARHGIAAHGRSGLNVWIPVREEVAAVRALLDTGFAVSAGERFRVKSPPAIRVTIATLEADEATRVAAALAASFAPPRRTHST